MRLLLFPVIYLLLLQAAIPRLVPDSWLIYHRVPYSVAKQDMAGTLDLAMSRVKREIDRHPDQEYIILLGDSVTYSGPGEADESIGAYLEQYLAAQGRPTRVYNFAQPAMHGADVYTVLLMLKQHGIPLRRIAVNQIYFSYSQATLEAGKFIGWLASQLRRLDRDAWIAAQGHHLDPPAPPDVLREWLLQGVALWRYRLVIRQRLSQYIPALVDEEYRDTRPWREKELWLRHLMLTDPIYQRFWDPRPILLDSSHPHINMLERMIAAAEGADLLFWFGPVNPGLLAEQVADPGYRANRERIDAFFATQPVRYLNLEHFLPDTVFTDHAHLTPEGYRQVAERLGREFLQ